MSDEMDLAAFVEELTRLKAENTELREVVAAALRLEIGGYLIWALAGGPGECAHGRAAGIPCRECDRQAVRYRGADLLK
jgi:hypothetical protein